MKPKGMRPPGDAEYRLWMIVWAAMVVSIPVCFGLARWIAPVAHVENANLEYILMSFAAAYVLVSIPTARWLLAQSQEVQSAPLRRAARVVPLVLCEMAAVTGLALRLVVGSSHYYIFLLLGLAGMLLHFPRKGQ